MEKKDIDKNKYFKKNKTKERVSKEEKNNKTQKPEKENKKSIKEKIKKFVNSEQMETFVFALIPIVLVIFMIVLQNVCLDIWFYIKIKVIAFTMLIFALMYVVLTVLFKNNKIPTIIMSFMVLIINLISHMRFIYSGEVLTFSDFVYVNNIGQISSLMSENLISVVLEILPIYLSAIVFISLLTLLVSKYKLEIKIELKKKIITLLICIILSFICTIQLLIIL